MLSIVDKYAPLRTMRGRSRSSPWITSELKKIMHNRNILKIKATRSNDPFDWMQFKKQRNIVNNEIRGQFYKTFTSVISKCSYCFQTLKQWLHL